MPEHYVYSTQKTVVSRQTTTKKTIQQQGSLFSLLDTNHFWVTESITDRHAFKVDLHFSSGVVFVDVIGNGGDVLPCIRLDRSKA